MLELLNGLLRDSKLSQNRSFVSITIMYLEKKNKTNGTFSITNDLSNTKQTNSSANHKAVKVPPSTKGHNSMLHRACTSEGRSNDLW